MNNEDFEAMVREHFGLLPEDHATASTVTNLTAFARKVYNLGEANGSYNERLRAKTFGPVYREAVTERAERPDTYGFMQSETTNPEKRS